MRVVFLSLCLSFFSEAVPAADLNRSLTLSSGYVEKFFNSNESLIHAPLSVMQGYSKLFDVVTDGFRDHWGKRLTSTLIDIPFSAWLASALTVPFHEFGHGRAMAALGLPYTYGSVGYGHHFRNLSSFWALSAVRLITPPWPFPGSGLAYTATSGSTGTLSAKMFNQKGEMSGINLMITTAGLNNQMMLAKGIGTMVYENNGHPLYLSHYVANKIHGFVYTLRDVARADENLKGDPRLIMQGLQERGINAQARHLYTLYWVSLLSGTTASLLNGYYRYIVHNESAIAPLEIFGVRIPDVNGFLTAQGLSFEIESDYRINDHLSAGLSYEFVWLGKNAHEVSPRVRYNVASALPSLNELWLKATMVIGKGVGGSLSADLAPLPIDDSNFSSRFSYFFEMRIFHVGTLYGERNIVSLDRGNMVAADTALGVRLRY